MELAEYTSYLATLTNHVHHRVIGSILEQERYIKEPERFFYSLLFKLNNGLDSANLFILNIFNKPHYSDSLFLILRTLISDIITLDYILTKSKGNASELNEYIESVYYDHIKFELKNFDVLQLLYKESKIVIDNKKQELKNERKKFFDNSGNPKSYLKDIKSVSAMVKEIAQETKKKIPLASISDAFEHYSIFSKYEHLGDLTFHLIHRSFRDDQNQKNRILSEISCSVGVILHYQGLLISTFFGKDTQEYKAFNELKAKIMRTNISG